MPVKKDQFISRVPVLNTLVRSCLVAGVASCLAHTASATILASESFSYADGDLLTVSGGLWVKSSGTSALNVLSGQAIVIFSQTDDDILSFAPVSSGSIYYGFTANVTTVPSASGSYFATFTDGETAANTDFLGRLQVAQGTTTSKVKFGIINDTTPNVPVYYTAAEFDLNTPVQIVVKFDFSTMLSTLWVNPVNESSPSVTDTVAAVFTGPATSLSGIVLRQASGIGRTAVDNLAVGTTFNDAIVAVPEPSTYALLFAGVGVLAIGWQKRKINGSKS